MMRKTVEHARRHAGYALPVLAIRRAHELGHQLGQVLEAVAQRRQREPQHLESRHQLAMQPALARQGLQRLLARGDHAHVGAALATLVGALEPAAVEEPEQSGLQRVRHMLDAVQEQHAALGALDRPGHAARPEQFQLEQPLGQCAAAHTLEWLLAARPGVVDGARDHALAGAGLAFDQHRRAHVGRTPHGLAHALDRTRCAGERLDAGATVELVLHLGHAPRQSLAVDALTQRRDDGRGVDRLGEALVGAAAHRFERHRVRRAIADEHDAGPARSTQRLGVDHEAIQPRRACITHNTLDPAADRVHRGIRVLHDAHREPGAGQRFTQRAAICCRPSRDDHPRLTLGCARA